MVYMTMLFGKSKGAPQLTVLDNKLPLQVSYQWLRVVTSDFKYRQVSKLTKKSR